MAQNIRFILAALASIVVIASQAMAGLDPSPFINKKKYKHIIVRPLPILDNGEVDPVALVIESSVVSEDVIVPLSDKQKIKLLEIIELLKDGQDFSAIEKDWEKFIRGINESESIVDISAIIQWVMLSAYLGEQNDLIFYAQQVKHYNSVKNEIRGLKDRLASRIEFCTTPDIECPESIEDLKAEIDYLEDLNQTIGEDMQMLQAMLEEEAQKLTQYINLMSNIAKAWHDLAMNIIRNLRDENDDEDNSDNE
jgi:hypothetical protein